MSLKPGMLPSDDDCTRLERLGFEPCEDAESELYVRFPYRLGRTGIVYASHVPIPWGVYWRGPTNTRSMAWVKTLDTAIELLILVQ